MNRYGGVGALSNLYVSPSPYRFDQENSSLQRYGQLWAEEAAGSAFSLARDAETLAQMLTPIDLPQDSSIAAQLFGGQRYETGLSLQHFVNLLDERARLHRRHIADINHRHMHMQGVLFGAKLHGRMDGYKNAMRLEQVLSQLDEQRRREELQFWKDTMEVREQMWVVAKEYTALRHRMALFDGLEPGGTVYD